MNIMELLEFLDGRGIIITDEDQILSALQDCDLDSASKVVL